MRELLEPSRLPECWIPPSHVLECRARLETYLTCAEQRTGWAQRIRAALFHQGGAGPAGRGWGPPGRRRAAGRRRAVLAGRAVQLVIAALEVTVYEERLEEVRRQLLTAPGTCGARPSCPPASQASGRSPASP